MGRYLLCCAVVTEPEKHTRRQQYLCPSTSSLDYLSLMQHTGPDRQPVHGLAIDRNLAFYIIKCSWYGWVCALAKQQRRREQSRQGKQQYRLQPWHKFNLC